MSFEKELNRYYYNLKLSDTCNYPAEQFEHKTEIYGISTTYNMLPEYTGADGCFQKKLISLINVYEKTEYKTEAKNILNDMFHRLMKSNPEIKFRLSETEPRNITIRTMFDIMMGMNSRINVDDIISYSIFNNTYWRMKQDDSWKLIYDAVSAQYGQFAISWVPSMKTMSKIAARF